MRKNKNTSKIILAVIAAILATMITFSALNNQQKELFEKQRLIDLMQKTKVDMASAETYAYAISTKDLKAGEIVSDADVDFKEFKIKDPNDFENRSDVVNKILLRDITTGEPFTTSHIAKVSSDDLTLKDGYRALTLPADNFQGKSAKMVVGSSVDILSAGTSDDWGMENVRIIAFEGNKTVGSTSAPQDITNANAVTFEISAAEIADFITNVSKNRLVLVARSANDKKTFRKKAKPVPSYSSSASYPSLPNLPKAPTIENMSGLPQPLMPSAPASEVELIEANVKSKVTFD